MTADTLLTIGELSAATGVAVSALRYYDDLGLIAATQRVNGQRRFSRNAVGRVNFVRRGQRFGFSLTEIGVILDDSSGRARELASEKMTALRAQQIELATMLDLLEEMMACGCEVVAECPSVTMSTATTV